MKIFLFVIMLGTILSCTDSADRYVKRFEKIDIIKSLIPDTVQQMDLMQIRAKAQAENGCWKNLYFELKKTKEFEYTLKAFGTYESFGVCPEVLVIKDTVINFQPMEKGTYLFHVSRLANETYVETLVVE